MTGETENGRSINVISTLLPRKSNLAIAQAAATPKRRFAGTAITAATNVSRIAASASGSTIAATYTPNPLRSAEKKTNTNGTNRKTVRKKSAPVISVRRTNADSPPATPARSDDAGANANVAAAVVTFVVPGCGTSTLGAR